MIYFSPGSFEAINNVPYYNMNHLKIIQKTSAFCSWPTSLSGLLESGRYCHIGDTQNRK